MASKRKPAKAKATRSARLQRYDTYDRLHAELLHARAAIMTAVLCLQGKGVYDDVSISLRGAALLPVDTVMRALDDMRQKIRADVH